MIRRVPLLLAACCLRCGVLATRQSALEKGRAAAWSAFRQAHLGAIQVVWQQASECEYSIVPDLLHPVAPGIRRRQDID